MDIMLVLEFIMVFFAGWFLGQIYFAYKLNKTLRETAEKFGIKLDDLSDNFSSNLTLQVSPMPELFTEYLNSSILLYDKTTGDFICQGSDLKELATNAKEFKNILLAKVFDKEQTYFFIDGQIEVTYNNESRTG